MRFLNQFRGSGTSSPTKSRVQSGVLFLSALVLSLSSVGCGKGRSFVNSAELTAYTEAEQIYTELGLNLDTGSVQLPSLVFPVVNPRNSAEQIGKISLLKMLDRGSRLGIALNLSKVAQIQGSDGSMLPNGDRIPLTLPEGTSAVSFPVAGSNIRAYLALGPHVAVFGAALPIREFLELGQIFGQISVFPSFSFGKFTGVAGLFLGPTTGTNGFAVFTDLSRALTPDQLRELVPGWSPPGEGDARAVITSRVPDRKTQREIFDRMQEIGKKSGVVTLE
jgi:hypothetical protein